jgi:hypothetical protein
MSFLLFSLLVAQDSLHRHNTNLGLGNCLTPSSNPEQILQTKQMVENWSSNNRDRPEEQLHILVAFHVIHSSDGTGNISDQAIYDQFSTICFV